MAKFWVEQQTSPKSNENQKTKCPERKEDNGIISRVFPNSSFTNLHRFALLHHRALPSTTFAHKSTIQQPNCRVPSLPVAELNSNTKTSLSIKDMMFNPKAPLVIAVSHSDRASRFHQSNGFQPVLRLPFHDEKEDVTPFYIHVLILDPFCTGKLNEMKSALHCTNNLWENELDLPSTQKTDLSFSQSSSVLL